MSSQIFREYIGATNQQIDLKSVPNIKAVPFHFLLAFATDYDGSGTHQNGVFQQSWRADFTAEMISKYKTTYNDAQVLLSIGWYDDSLPFKETDKSTWISNAITSIGGIINDLNLDGLDVNYWKIDAKDSAIFAECIGEVIKQLKKAKIARTVSVSPRPTLDDYYSKLYSLYKDYIDLVNYQFYSGTDSLDTIKKFKDAIGTVKGIYPDGNVIVGYSTDKRDKKIKMPKDVLFNAYDQMSDQLSGIFVWSADVSPPGFQFEQDAQKMLAGV